MNPAAERLFGYRADELVGDQTPLLQVEQMRAKIDVMQMQLDDAFKRDKLQIDTAMKLTELEEKAGKQLNKEVMQNEVIQ
mgnify:CR=1 FL=1